MDYILDSERMLDRDVESKSIASQIEDQSDKNQVLFLWARTGVGKSSAIRKALKRQTTNKRIIWVETPPTNHNELVVQGQYLTHIASALDEALAKEGDSLYDFLRKGSSKRTTQANWQDAINGTVAGAPFAAIGILARRFLKTGSMDADRILSSSSEDSILVMREYVQQLFTRDNIILVVTNFQNIDSTSMEYLRGLSEKTKGNFFIFEFTVENQDTTKMWQYAELFRQCKDVGTKHKEIDKLPIAYAKKLVGPALAESKEFDQFYSNTICGNIYKLKESSRQVESGSSHKMYSDPFSALESLPYESGILLQIVCLHGGCASKEKIQHILSSSDQPLMSKRIEQNMECLHQYVTCEGGFVKVNHASIGDYALRSNSPKMNKAALVAYGLLRDVLNNNLNKKRYIYYSEKEMVVLLLSLYAQFSPNSISSLINNFKEIIINEISEEQSTLLVDKILNHLSSTSNSILDETLSGLIKLCYDVGLYNKAMSLLYQRSVKDNNYLMYQVSLLNRLDKHEDVIQICNSILSRRGNPVRFELIIKLIRLLSERSLNQSEQYEKTYQELLQNSQYMNIMEYGFVLRNAEMIYDHRKSAEYAQKSVRFFEEHDSISNANISRLTLATELACIGELLESEKLIELIEQDIYDATTEKHIVYTDKAAIALLDGRADEDVLLLLEKAAVTSHNTFDSLTILSNKLCWYIENRRAVEDFDDLLRQINRIITEEPDRRLHKRIYVNLAQYFAYVIPDSQKQKEYMAKAAEITDVVDALSHYFITGEGKETLGFLSEKPYYVSFISYWHFELPSL